MGGFWRFAGCTLMSLHPLFDSTVELVLVLWEPIEPKHRDVTVVEKVEEGFATGSYNLPSTQLLETRIGYLARAALWDMTRFAYRTQPGFQGSDTPPAAEAVSAVREEFARGQLQVRVLLGTAAGGKNADVDNCLKLVADALVPVLYPNDRNVDEMVVRRISNHPQAAEIALDEVVPTIINITRFVEYGDSAPEQVYVFPARHWKQSFTRKRVVNAPE